MYGFYPGKIITLEKTPHKKEYMIVEVDSRDFRKIAYLTFITVHKINAVTYTVLR